MTQTDALNILKTGASIFLTGNAGSGKTYLLNRYIEWLSDCGIGFAVTASTGIAATHLGGQTIHSFTGIGIRQELSPYDLDELGSRKYLHDRFSKVKVLIIDEVSMLHASTLDLVDEVCRLFKDGDKPFGGLQIIMSGDFFQLPPIDRNRESDDVTAFAYNARAWRALDPVICYLTEQHRQHDDNFSNILNAIRNGSVDQDVVDQLSSRVGLDEAEMTVTRLYAHNHDIDRVNLAELATLEEDVHYYDMVTKGKSNLVETLKKSVLAPEHLALKPGALVMCVKNNYERGYVNGTLGTVVSCEADAPVIKTKQGKIIKVFPESWAIEEDGKIKAEVAQVPLRLAWAITIHKSQGMSLDSAVIDLSRSFTHGMGYVALSRLRTLDGLYLQGFNNMALSVHPGVASLDVGLHKQSRLAERAVQSLGEEKMADKHRAFVARVGGTWPEVGTVKDKKTSKQKRSLVDKTKGATEVETAKMISEGKTIAQVAKERKLTTSTIFTHLEKALTNEVPVKLDHLKPNHDLLTKIKKAFHKTKDNKLSPVKTILDKEGFDCSFDDIRLARLFVEFKK
ncbi:MAG: AAA family ATPase [Candidatus Vogelbacteria bacterium]|nr:AAA family ATPase [Candidatus Vogelbacteria bacterium]